MSAKSIDILSIHDKIQKDLRKIMQAAPEIRKQLRKYKTKYTNEPENRQLVGIIADLKEFVQIEIEMMEAEAEINKDIATHEMSLQPQEPETEDQMALNDQEHEHTMKETKAKADHSIRVERVKAQTKRIGMPNRSGGKNGSAKGGSNTDE